MQYIENGIVQLDNLINPPRVRIWRPEAPARAPAAGFVEIVQFSTRKRAAGGSEKMHNSFTTGSSCKLQAVTFFLWSDPKKESNQRKKDRGVLSSLEGSKEERTKEERSGTRRAARNQHAEPSRFTTLNTTAR